MPTDWADKVRAAITNLETKTDRVLEPDKALAIIDDVVAGKFAAAELATIQQENLKVNIAIMRAFVRLREALETNRELAQKFSNLKGASANMTRRSPRSSKQFDNSSRRRKRLGAKSGFTSGKELRDIERAMANDCLDDILHLRGRNRRALRASKFCPMDRAAWDNCWARHHLHHLRRHINWRSCAV